ncbi:hypothetical protein KC19_3G087800 [Ceratodon purpureus]|uniref:Uncharacterized protein n=1 Tax=Ceratodon purpureus TaxID=3225 RepID=A0A8T0IGG2_CERPU|nr:hypothetical protein KC19_3G087800 [Ceratodon purpureus]
MLDTKVWVKHRTSWRHGRHMSSSLSSGIMSAVGPPVFMCTLLATFVTIFNQLVKENQLWPWIPALEVPSLPFYLTSAVLLLLLVFRASSSYNRYDEASKLWMLNASRARDITRQALAWIRSPNDTSKLFCLLRHVKAYAFCLQDHLTEETHLNSKLKEIMEPQELDAIMSAKHRPSHVLHMISNLVQQCNISEWEKMAMDDNISIFNTNLGECERILNTPIPLAYTLLTSRFLIMWHLALPFALSGECGWLTIPAAFLVATSLFYIEEVGVLIDEPFWILSLGPVTDGIVIEVDELLQYHEARSSLPYHMQDRSEIDDEEITIEASGFDGFDRQGLFM